MSEFSNIQFEMPKNTSNTIKVIGVGGGGSNAVNHMLAQGINGVDFIVCNTDAQALENSQVPTKIQLGLTLTEGLGAGANPEVGMQSALESEAEIKAMLSGNTKMVFINAGMGGGTGTGAAPVIAKFARELDLLTIGIVTIPFSFEGKTRIDQAQAGIEELRKHVDSLVVINNNKLREVYGNLGFKAGFAKADEVLATASRGIAEVITHHYTQNIDLRDAKTVLANSGTAIMGSAKASGSNRAEEAIMKALDSPLLNDNKITGAKNVLLLIVSGTEEITIDEIGEINDYIQSEAKTSVNIIMGVGEDESLGDAVAVTIVATGFHKDQQNEISNIETKKIIHSLEEEQKVTYDFSEKNELIPKVQEPIIHQLEEEVVERKVYSLEDDIEVESSFVPTPTPVSEVTKVDKVAQEVFSEEVDDFVITSVAKGLEVDSFEEVVSENKNQFEFTFDLPISNTKKVETSLLNVNDIEVIGHVVVVPKPQLEPVKQIENIVHFDLGDYDELENRLNSATKKIESQVEEDEELQMNVRTEEPIQQIEVRDFQEVSPMHLTIHELQNRAQNRKDRMKQFNYKFTNQLNQNIDEIEREPAYKRMGVELNKTISSSDSVLSKTSLSVDDQNNLKFRSNNSFLHDNVD